ncbi:Protein of unknown function (DUF3095) [Shimia isoporae]|uniref:DUF3095 family protein n=1 Tax=Shimia isoporae TaxID=647720 RepID=A0A4V6NFR4_9RHOB|nr:DUF3095 domain-containing protein [Shimia isoporae]TCL07990.1 Protein of unknown function (DUF3095) [Shimia isoporae]
MFFNQSTQDYYENLPRTDDFDSLSDLKRYVPLPDDWVVGVADVVGSTHEIARGRYKVVNMVGAAVISAQINAAQGAALPFVFGGDGAGFAVWPTQRRAAERALDSVRRWARKEFEIELRVAMVSVADVRAAGRDVRVARYAPSKGVDYAMFSGGGLAWAEAQMKAGHMGVDEDTAVEDTPDLTGLSCRWSNVKSERGAILSLVVEPQEDVPEACFAKIAEAVLEASQTEPRAMHPVPRVGPEARFPPPGMTIEARVRQGGPVAWKLGKLLVENMLIWALMKSRGVGNFDPTAYRAEVAENADFRKFDDGLKMTLDCDAETQARIEKVLRKAKSAGLVRYGLHAQSEAMMTCFVPSATESNHMHFVDGAAGGYAQAAARL